MKNLASENNYKYIKDINAFYGISNGYYFYSESTQYVSLFRLIFTINVESPDVLKEALDAICESYRSVSHEGVRFEEGKAILEIRPQGFEASSELKSLIDSLTQTMQSMNVKQYAEGTSEGLGLYRVGTHLAVKTSTSVASDVENYESVFKKQSSNPLRAFMNAFIYMIPAIAVYAVIYNIGFISSIVTYAILLQAFRGFEKYAMRPTKSQLIILLIMALFGLYIGWIIAFTFQIYQGFGTLGMAFQLALRSPLEIFFKANIAGIGLALLFNFEHIKGVFSNAREGVVVNRKIKKLL